MAILTIAREYGSGGKEIGRRVAEEMDYDYVDRGRILEDMKKSGSQWEEQAKQFDENSPDVWERFKWSFRGYVALIQYHILNYALQDKVVIMGRGGNFLLKNVPYAMRVRTESPLKKRVETVMLWEEMNAENAQYLIEKADKEMAGAVYLTYGHSWDDRTQYDMIFDTNLQSYDEIVSIIKEELVRREQLHTPKAQEVLELKALAAKIKADLAIDPAFHISSLSVEFKEEGLVEYGLLVKGAVHEGDDAAQIKDFVSKVCGAVPVEFDLKYRWPSRLGRWRFK
jgi:cytidylate kinase